MSVATTSGLAAFGDVGSPMPRDAKVDLPSAYSSLGLVDPPTIQMDEGDLWSMSSSARYVKQATLSFRIESMRALATPMAGAKHAFVLQFSHPRKGWRRWFRRFDRVERWCVPSGTVDEVVGDSVLVSADEVGPELGYILTAP